MRIRRILTTAATAALLVFPAAAASAHSTYDGGACEPGYALAEGTCEPDWSDDEYRFAHPDAAVAHCQAQGLAVADDLTCVPDTYWDEPAEDDPSFDCRLHGNRTCAYPVDLGDGATAYALATYDAGTVVAVTWRDVADVEGMAYPVGTDAHGAPVYVVADGSADGIGYTYAV